MSLGVRWLSWGSHPVSLVSHFVIRCEHLFVALWERALRDKTSHKLWRVSQDLQIFFPSTFSNFCSSIHCPQRTPVKRTAQRLSGFFFVIRGFNTYAEQLWSSGCRGVSTVQSSWSVLQISAEGKDNENEQAVHFMEKLNTKSVLMFSTELFFCFLPSTSGSNQTFSLCASCSLNNTWERYIKDQQSVGQRFSQLKPNLERHVQ